jgi:hypothetical protein
MAGATPLIPLVGGFRLTVVALADMSGGSRGRVPERDTVASIEATMVSMVGTGLDWTGELGLWIVWKLPAEAVDDSDSDKDSTGVR